MVNTLGNIRPVDTVKECTVFRTRTFSWEVGRRTNFKGKAYICTQMGKSIKANFNRVSNMEEELICIKIILFMRDSGQKIEKMGLVSSRIIMARNTKEIG